jgi:hypothetical protein
VAARCGGRFDPGGGRAGRAEPAGGGQQEQDRRNAEAEAADDGCRAAGHVVRDQRRNVVDHIAEKAAETGRQRPAVGHGQGGQRSGGEAGTDQPVEQPFAADAERVPGQEPPAPENQRDEEYSGCETDGLHQDIGEDRTRRAEGVAYLAARAWLRLGSLTDQVASAAAIMAARAMMPRPAAPTRLRLAKRLSGLSVSSKSTEPLRPLPRTALARLMLCLPSRSPIGQERFRSAATVPSG